MSNVFKVYNLLTDTTDILIDVAEKASWDPANRRQKLDFVWENTVKFSQIYNDNFYLLFSPLIYFMVTNQLKVRLEETP
jgi:hypothetical protein